MNAVYLYGIGGPSDRFRVIRYTRVEEKDVSIMTFKFEALMMRVKYPNIRQVFAMDDGYHLYRSYMDAVKKNSIEGWMIFRDILGTQGAEIL